MSEQSEKIKLIYKPFFIIAICIIGGYSLVNWLLFKKLQVFSINEDIVNFWGAFAIPWLPVIIWLRPKIKLLDIKNRRSDLPGPYILAACFAIIAPTLVAQSYIQTASGKLTKLDSVAQFEKQPSTKYYSLKNFYIDHTNIGVANTFEVSGKNNQYFNMNLYVVLPIFNTATDTSSRDCIAWYGIKYFQQISNRLDQNEKEKIFQKFRSISQDEFDKMDVKRFVYLDKIGNTDDHKGYVSAIKNNKKYSRASTVVLVPVNERFEARNGDKFPWIFGAFGIGAIVWLIMILIPSLDQKELEKINSGRKDEKNNRNDELYIFLPRDGFYVTPIIMDLNILIFVAMICSGAGFFSFKAIDLVSWGANYKPSTVNGQWWRLLSSTFLHGGLMHLIANIVGLLFVGIFLEPLLGKVKYAVIYLVSGTIASLTSLWWHEATVSVGASGAIFGLYGVFLTLLLTHSVPKVLTNTMLASTLIFVGYNLAMGLAGGIDNAAHVGGLLSGVVIGLFLYPHIRRKTAAEDPRGR